jgi:dolichol-phosphate mannosyltransferase
MQDWKSILRRWVKFNAVGATGVLVQMTTLVLLLKVSGMHYLAATALAVEASVLNNFVWHRKWTWADRPQSKLAVTLVRFNLTSGATSMAANLLLMWLLVSAARLEPVYANLITIMICSIINFMLNDRLVFI